MASPAKVIELELDAPIRPLEPLDGYRNLYALVRLHGTPIGRVEVPVTGGLTAPELRAIARRQLARPILKHRLKAAIGGPLPVGGAGGEEPVDVSFPDHDGDLPLVTVAVCTRDRPEDLRLCIESLLQLDYPHLDILVVDNAPTSDATSRLVRGAYPRVRYVCEPRPGLDWARNRAIAEARGDIVAFTDDDVVVDPRWAGALAGAFEDLQVMAVTGLVVPYELETEAQILFERRGGFGRGYDREYWRRDVEGGQPALLYLGAGKYGTGANMAFRRSVFESIGGFDPALDVGTVTNGGGDLEMFFRVVYEGHLLAYEPGAMVRHRHRRGYAQLRTQLTNNGIGLYSYLVRTMLAYPEVRGDALKFGRRWLWAGSLRPLIRSCVRPSRVPRGLIWAEFRGSLSGLTRYPRAGRRLKRIAAPSDNTQSLTFAPVQRKKTEGGDSIASVEPTMGVRMVDLCRPLRGLDDVAGYAWVRVFIALDDRPIGRVDIRNHHQPVSAARLREALADHFSREIIERVPEADIDVLQDDVVQVLRRRCLPSGEPVADDARLPNDVPVSVVVATYDRPDDLRNCLRRLVSQESCRPVEIVVVDNHPASGLTPPVVAEFPGVVLVDEERQGLAYARNKGFTESRGEIVVATDDDVSVPADWLEKLVAPFARPDVMAVTGNTLPIELETTAQRSFEQYGGLGRGFVRKEADAGWFRSIRRAAVPTWELGATANAAFRVSIFTHPEIGLMDEALGPGTPTGVGEDTYLFYKVLKAGYTLVYEPSAYVWHKHRREMRSLENQMYNYSKGHVAYHLTTLLRDGDLRAVRHLAVHLPRWQMMNLARYAKRRLQRRKTDFPLKLLLIGVRGTLAGSWSLWRSRRRVKREGHSDPYVPVSRRTGDERLHATRLDV